MNNECIFNCSVEFTKEIITYIQIDLYRNINKMCIVKESE